ncbi:phage holin family protein [Volucribacter amazonae]|uniref:Membrane protein YqjE n=1 Tax=Volucribacter amazonae TaxID=256731 RepID=A0A9X4PBH2_9PAST|nr:phage holin family protein [Volucribacter amazonae]MDG6896028.1 hypothetical protein [Volucribacter amazonae]
MQAIQNIKKGIKALLVTSLELLHVRLEMARIELTQQKESLIFTLILTFLGLILLLIAFISGLFGLNALLVEPQDKIRVFFGVSAVALLIVFAFAVMIIQSLRKQRRFMVETLNELKLDIAALKKLANSSHLDKE